MFALQAAGHTTLGTRLAASDLQSRQKPLFFFLCYVLNIGLGTSGDGGIRQLPTRIEDGHTLFNLSPTYYCANDKVIYKTSGPVTAGVVLNLSHTRDPVHKNSAKDTEPESWLHKHTQKNTIKNKQTFKYFVILTSLCAKNLSKICLKNII